MCMTSVWLAAACLTRPSALLAPAPAAVMLEYLGPAAFLALAPAAVMLAYLRSSACLAVALDALVGADARPQALLAPAPAAVIILVNKRMRTQLNIAVLSEYIYMSTR